MRKHWQNLVLPLLYSLLFSIAAAAQAAPADRGIEYFRVVPGNCIVQSEHLCEVQFQFYWRLHRAEEICIYQHRSDAAVYCSPDWQTGDTAMALAVEETTRFTLVLKDAPEHSASRDVRVLAIGRDIRLRRRHVWSIF